MNVRRITMIGLLAASCAVWASLYVPAAAVAGQPQNPVLADCGAHPGGLVGHYSVQQLRHALQIMPPETREYTSCPDVVNRALLAALGKSGGSGSSSGGGSGSFLPTPVIVVLVVLALAAVTFGALAIRRRQQDASPNNDRDDRPSGTGAGDNVSAESADGPEGAPESTPTSGPAAVSDEPPRTAGESPNARELGD